MGNGCSLHRGRVAPDPKGSPKMMRRVGFFGMGRSGKTTVVEWVLQHSYHLNESQESTKDTSSKKATTPKAPLRTLSTQMHTLQNETVVLLDTPALVCDENGSVVIEENTLERMSAVIYVVDITDPIRSVLAYESFISLLEHLLPRVRQGTPVVILGNHKFKSQDIRVDVSLWEEQATEHSELACHFAIESLVFSTKQDISHFVDSVLKV